MQVQENQKNRKGDEFLERVYAIIEEQSIAHGLNNDISLDLSLAVVEVIRFEFSGQILYVSKGRLIESEKLASEVYEFYKLGETVPEIARAFRLSIQHTYEIIRKQRKRRIELL